jgi:hypothetical protein
VNETHIVWLLLQYVSTVQSQAGPLPMSSRTDNGLDHLPALVLAVGSRCVHTSSLPFNRITGLADSNIMASMRQSVLLQPQRLAKTAAWQLQASRGLSTSTGRLSANNGKGQPAGKQGDGTPIPPKGVDSSTSALDYKLQHPRPRPPSLPSIDPPKWSAEYAVTNIL